MIQLTYYAVKKDKSLINKIIEFTDRDHLLTYTFTGTMIIGLLTVGYAIGRYFI